MAKKHADGRVNKLAEEMAYSALPRDYEMVGDVLQKHQDDQFYHRLHMSWEEIGRIIDPILRIGNFSIEDRIQGGGPVHDANFAEALETIKIMKEKVELDIGKDTSWDAILEPLDKLSNDITLIRGCEARQNKAALDRLMD